MSDNMELKQIWEEALKIIEEETSPVSFETWIQPIIPCGMEGHQVILQVENAFFKEMLEKRYAERYPIYTGTCDVHVKNDSTAEALAEKIIREDKYFCIPENVAFVAFAG